MKRLFLCVVVLVGFLCFNSQNIVEAAQWVWVDSTDYATISIDKSSARKYNGIVYYWDQWEYIDSERRNEEIDALTRNDQMYGDGRADYSDLRSIKNHICAFTSRDGTAYCKFLGTTYYDSQGRVISSDSFPESATEWEALVPDSIGEEEYHVARAYAR